MSTQDVAILSVYPLPQPITRPWDIAGELQSAFQSEVEPQMLVQEIDHLCNTLYQGFRDISQWTKKDVGEAAKQTALLSGLASV